MKWVLEFSNIYYFVYSIEEYICRRPDWRSGGCPRTSYGMDQERRKYVFRTMGNPFGCIFINQRFSESFKIVLFVCLSPVYQIISRSILFFDRKSPLWRNKNEWTQQPFSHYLQNGKNFHCWEWFYCFQSDKNFIALYCISRSLKAENEVTLQMQTVMEQSWFPTW